MSAARCFFDTNIFLYSLDRTDARKQSIANDLVLDALYRANGVVSYQVVQEFVNAALKKFPGTMSDEESSDYLRNTFAPMLAVESSLNLFRQALTVHWRYKFNWYDCLILAAAIEAKCDVLDTEDLSHGQRFGELVVVDPFREAFPTRP